MPQLARVRQAGMDVISLNVSFDIVNLNDAFKVLQTFQHWIQQRAEDYVLTESVTDIEASKAAGNSRYISASELWGSTP